MEPGPLKDGNAYKSLEICKSSYMAEFGKKVDEFSQYQISSNCSTFSEFRGNISGKTGIFW